MFGKTVRTQTFDPKFTCPGSFIQCNKLSINTAENVPVSTGIICIYNLQISFILKNTKSTEKQSTKKAEGTSKKQGAV